MYDPMSNETTAPHASVRSRQTLPLGVLTRPVDLSSLSEGPRGIGLLMEMSGPDAGRLTRLVGTETTLGRGNDCTLCFHDPTLSRLHARIVRNGTDFVFEDIGSQNGSLVNSRRVEQRVLRHGDRLRLGSGVQLQFHRVNEDEEQTLLHLYKGCVHDGLTGAYNRRYLEDSLALEISYADRHGTELCVLMLDLDHFKRVNDFHGHLAGDEVLRRIVSTLRPQIRREDFIARYDGDEFALMVREIDLGSAARLAERVQQLVEKLEIHFEGTILRITTSIGVASLRCCGSGHSPSRLLACADEALYRAKRSGRNRVVAV